MRHGRNDRGAVYPPEQTNYQGQTGLTSWVQGRRLAHGASAARLVFNTDHEIQSLAGTQVQAANIANEIPSIAAPVVPCHALCHMLQQGCYVRVAHGSGFPIVIIRDGGDPGWMGPGRLWNAAAALWEPSHYESQLIVDHSGIWCPPCEEPMIMPPTARYIGGFHTVPSSYPIGGYWTDDGGATVHDAGINWYEYLETSLEPFASGPKPTIYNGYFAGDVTTVAADFTIYLPAMPTKWSFPRNGIADYRGCFSMSCASSLVNVTMTYDGVDHDCSTSLLQGWTSGETDLGYIQEDLPQYVISTYWFRLRWFLDDKDQENGRVTENAHFQVEL